MGIWPPCGRQGRSEISDDWRSSYSQGRGGSMGASRPPLLPAFSPNCLLLKAESVSQWLFRGQVRTKERTSQDPHAQGGQKVAAPGRGSSPSLRGQAPGDCVGPHPWHHPGTTLPLPESGPARPAQCPCSNAHSGDTPGTLDLDPQTPSNRGQAVLGNHRFTAWPWPRFATPTLTSGPTEY